MEKEVIQPYYEDDYQSLDEMSTINQILDSRINGERPKLAKEKK